MIDGLLQPHIGGLVHGVSRQAPLQRSPSQFEVLDNYLPTVDVGGIVDRAGTSKIVALDKAQYAAGGPHHFFRTTDGQRWALLRRVETGNFEVRNVDTGSPATLTIPATVKNYLATAGGALRFLSIADTTLVCNTAVTVTATEPAVPEQTAAYVYLRRTSTAEQRYFVGTDAGEVYSLDNDADENTREWIAERLMRAINTGMVGGAPADSNPPEIPPLAGLNATLLGNCPSVVKITGSAELIAQLRARNDWDADAIVLIKGRVTSTNDLPPAFEAGVPIMLDVGRGDLKKAYYVQFDPEVNAYIECSYLGSDLPTATLTPTTLPVKMRQTGDNAFTFEHAAWTPRTKGDSKSNPLPFFVNRKLSDLAQWKGRLILASQDTLCFSQPDDLFNYFKETARESRPADPIELPTDSPDLSVVHHVVAFRNKLIVTADNAQLEVPGDKPLTPDSATIGVATRYALDKDCRPTVVGDALYYTGTVAGRSALWEYAYDDGAASNVATDLSKHVPGYVPGRVSRIVGSSQAGRLFLLTSSDPAAVYVHTAYWKEAQRAQSAWSRLTFPAVSNVRDVWVDEGVVVILAETSGHLWLLSFSVDADLGADPVADQRIDFRTYAPSGTWNGTYTAYSLPEGYSTLGEIVLTVAIPGDEWVTEFTGTVVSNQLRVNTQVPAGMAMLGIRVPRTYTFSPFYMTEGEQQTALGRLQVRQVILDLLRTGDFTATVARVDRTPPLQVQRSARVVGAARARPIVGRNVQQSVPFNSKGDAATLSVTTDSTVPSVLTGYTLRARFTNPFA